MAQVSNREAAMSIRVVVIEDHPLVLKAVVDVLASHGGEIQVVGTTTQGTELSRLVRETTPDVVILDLGMSTGRFEPVTAIRSLLAEHPSVRILVLTGYDDDVLVRAVVNAGALGYVLKSDDLSLMLPLGVERVFSGKRFYSEDIVDKIFPLQLDSEVKLNEQELVMIRLVSEGLSNLGIAESMQLSEKRVRNALSIIYAKLDIPESGEINSRIAAINKARDLGLLSSNS